MALTPTSLYADVLPDTSGPLTTTAASPTVTVITSIVLVNDQSTSVAATLTLGGKKLLPGVLVPPGINEILEKDLIAPFSAALAGWSVGGHVTCYVSSLVKS